MSTHPENDGEAAPEQKSGNGAARRKVTTHTLRRMKERGVPISALTAYDFLMAELIDLRDRNELSYVIERNLERLPVWPPCTGPCDDAPNEENDSP